jgi:hypothetical protein
MEFGILFVILVVVALAFRLLAGGMDHTRVRQYIEAKGGRLIEAHWAPFGPGWFGEKSDRIYELRYLDADSNEHHAHCKTGLWTGVYFTQNDIVRQANFFSEQKAMSLEAENRLLRQELERLRGNQS